MSEALDIGTPHTDIGDVLEELAPWVDDVSLRLPCDRAIADGEWVRFRVLLADGAAVFEGVGRAQGSSGEGAERRLHLSLLQFDERNEVMYERMLLSQDREEVTGEIDVAALGLAKPPAAKAQSPGGPPSAPPAPASKPEARSPARKPAAPPPPGRPAAAGSSALPSSARGGPPPTRGTANPIARTPAGPPPPGRGATAKPSAPPPPGTRPSERAAPAKPSVPPLPARGAPSKPSAPPPPARGALSKPSAPPPPGTRPSERGAPAKPSAPPPAGRGAAPKPSAPPPAERRAAAKPSAPPPAEPPPAKPPPPERGDPGKASAPPPPGREASPPASASDSDLASNAPSEANSPPPRRPPPRGDAPTDPSVDGRTADPLSEIPGPSRKRKRKRRPLYVPVDESSPEAASLDTVVSAAPDARFGRREEDDVHITVPANLAARARALAPTLPKSVVDPDRSRSTPEQAVLQAAVRLGLAALAALADVDDDL